MAEQTEQISIRVNPPLLSFLKRWGSAVTPPIKPATAARFALDMFKAMTDELGADWREVVLRAGAAGQDPGAYIGAMVKVLFEAERKAKK